MMHNVRPRRLINRFFVLPLWRNALGPFILFLVVAGCVEVKSLSLRPGEFEPRPEGSPVSISQGSIIESLYIELGHVSAVGCTMCSSDRVLSKLKEKVRAMGGDAVFDLDTYTAPGGTVGAGGLTIQGNAARKK